MNSPASPEAAYSFEDLYEGQQYSFFQKITNREMTAFRQLSGDDNPLHRDDSFAQSRGFESKVVYGLLLACYVSKMVGRFLPGKNCLLMGTELKFVSPCYVGDTIEVTAVVAQVSAGLKTAVLKIAVKKKDNGAVLARGKTTVGFTEERPRDGDR